MQLMRLASAVEVELWKELMSIFDEMGEFGLSNSQGRNGQQGSHSPYYPRSLWENSSP
ncbi:hypothetical protein A2U01_0025546 [Trifolium medium]|nr:hypothetical protein [Trifolium medium]